jgi:PmbA protein
MNVKIGADGFNLIDDPHIPRGLGSHYTDSDGIPTQKMHLVQNGILQNVFISVYNSRRLKMPRTTGGSSNLRIPNGARSPEGILKNLPKAIRVEGFLGGNANPLTGDFSFGVNGMLFEYGEPIQGVSEMNISGNLFSLLSKWSESANDEWRYGTCRSPSLLFDNIQFSGT